MRHIRIDDDAVVCKLGGGQQARVTGYCIKFTRLSVINADVLLAAIRHGMTVDQTG